MKLPGYRSACVVGGLLSGVFARSGLLVHDLDLLVDHPAGKPIDRNVHPVMLLPCYVEPSEICFSRRVFSALSDHVDQQSPSPRLRRVAQGPCYCFSCFFVACEWRIGNCRGKSCDILPIHGWLCASRGCNRRSSGIAELEGTTAPALVASSVMHPVRSAAMTAAFLVLIFTGPARNGYGRL